MSTPSAWDVTIIGAGPAGLSAALVLGRCRRRVLIVDAGCPRNAASPVLHGFLTQDGIAPTELLRIGREQLRPYDTIVFREGQATHARRTREQFVVRLADGTRIVSRRLIFATGVVDRLPGIEGARTFYGHGVYHCPYCDAYEVRDRPIAVYGKGTKGVALAHTLLNWSREVVLCTDGPASLGRTNTDRLERNGIRVRKERIVRLEGQTRLERVLFARGEALPCAALFFNTGQCQRSRLPLRLGCKMKDGALQSDSDCQTAVPGVYLAGDASKDVQLAIVAAAEGVRAAFAVHKSLASEEFV